MKILSLAALALLLSTQSMESWFSPDHAKNISNPQVWQGLSPADKTSHVNRSLTNGNIQSIKISAAALTEYTQEDPAQRTFIPDASVQAAMVTVNAAIKELEAEDVKRTAVANQHLEELKKIGDNLEFLSSPEAAAAQKVHANLRQATDPDLVAALNYYHNSNKFPNPEHLAHIMQEAHLRQISISNRQFPLSAAVGASAQEKLKTAQVALQASAVEICLKLGANAAKLERGLDATALILGEKTAAAASDLNGYQSDNDDEKPGARSAQMKQDAAAAAAFKALAAQVLEAAQVKEKAANIEWRKARQEKRAAAAASVPVTPSSAAPAPTHPLDGSVAVSATIIATPLAPAPTAPESKPLPTPPGKAVTAGTPTTYAAAAAPAAGSAATPKSGDSPKKHDKKA